MQYKTVPATAHITASSVEELESRVRYVADKINEEAKNGWEFVGMYPVSGTVNHKLSSNLSQRFLNSGYDDGNYTMNMMVFRKN